MPHEFIIGDKQVDIRIIPRIPYLGFEARTEAAYIHTSKSFDFTSYFSIC